MSNFSGRPGFCFLPVFKKLQTLIPSERTTDIVLSSGSAAWTLLRAPEVEEASLLNVNSCVITTWGEVGGAGGTNNDTKDFSQRTNMLKAGRETTTLSSDGWLLPPWLRRRMNDEYPISAVNLLSHARFAFKYPAGGRGIIKENSFLSHGGFIHLFV